MLVCVHVCAILLTGSLLPLSGSFTGSDSPMPSEGTSVSLSNPPFNERAQQLSSQAPEVVSWLPS